MFIRWVNAAACGFCAIAGHGLAAQNALDRTNPAQQVEVERPLPALSQPVRIEFEPVLESPLADAPDEAIEVAAIVIDGLVTLSRADFASAIENFAGLRLNRGELTQLTDALVDVARSRGLVLATAWVPEQSVTAGMLRVRVDEGTIDAVRVEGVDDPAIRQQLGRLVTGRPVLLAELQREVLLASDLPGVWIRSTRFENEGGRRILVVDARRRHFGGLAEVSTDGIKPVGPLRARIDLDANGLISARDRVDLTFSTTPVEPDELAFFSARYSLVVNDKGTNIGVFGAYSRTEPGAYLADAQLLGKAWQAGLRLRHPLLRGQRRSAWLESSFELQDLKQDAFAVRAREDRIALARLGLYGFGPVAGGVLQGQITATQGLDVLGATVAGDPLASRFDASADFSKLSWWWNWRSGLLSRLSLSLAATGQFSSAPLLIGESFTLGGNAFLRGYDFAQRIGDQGIAGLAELRYDWPRAFGTGQQVQVYAFADAGTVSFVESGFAGGSLASSGAGLRMDVSRSLNLDAEVAMPLTEPRYDTADNTPRLNIRVNKSF